MIGRVVRWEDGHEGLSDHRAGCRRARVCGPEGLWPRGRRDIGHDARGCGLRHDDRGEMKASERIAPPAEESVAEEEGLNNLTVLELY